MRFPMLVLGLSVLVAEGAGAQAPAGWRPSPVAYRSLAALQPTPRSVWAAAEAPAIRPLPARGKRREGAVLMIVGAAGIVTGLLVDESLVTILGAGVAGVGLYVYLSNDGTIRVDP